MRVALTLELPPEVIAAFAEKFDVLELPLRGSRLVDHVEALQGCDAIVLGPPVQLDAEFLAAKPASLRYVATYSVGHDHVDRDAAREHHIILLHTPDVLTDAVAENAMLLMLGATRRATESIALVRSGKWTGWTPMQLNGHGLSDKTLGIFGMGRIARGVAHRAQAFGMRAQYYDARKARRAQQLIAKHVDDLAEFLATTDVLLLAAPLNDTSRYFLDASKLAQMKPNAVVVNVGRGDLVRDDDLISALSSGQIFAAGLDVFSNEPNVDPRYNELPNVFMLPHIGSSTIETRLRMAKSLIDGFERLEQGITPFNVLT